ncbi:FecR family protein [Flavobacterium sp. N1736]|uniref:FecR family protein n=1 Tax=Flavobacterium sp. N1736 TaxID=2986823 RepID=UPI00222542B6|nr:FecR family protein [Flavobacterium sp. N1736]
MNKKLNQEEQDKKNLLWFLWLHDYFHRYYNKQASEKEIQIIKHWNPEKVIGASFEASESQVKKGIEKVWDALSVQYGFTKPDNKPVKVFTLQKLLSYAAAILVLMMASVTAYQYQTYDTFQSLSSLFSDKMEYGTGKGDVKKFILPDGSLITLNGSTTLTFAKNEFNGKKREIWLKDGEVFFEVAKNPHKPFIIHTHDADVVVKGTSFSVTAYDKLHKSTVAVRTGRVEVRKDHNILALFPSQKAIIDKKKKSISLSEVKTSNIATWREGNLTLSHSDADELMLRMEQHFDVEIKLQPGLLEDINFSASFDKETSLKNMLDVISDIYGVRYTITNHTVTLYK